MIFWTGRDGSKLDKALLFVPIMFPSKESGLHGCHVHGVLILVCSPEVWEHVSQDSLISSQNTTLININQIVKTSTQHSIKWLELISSFVRQY